MDSLIWFQAISLLVVVVALAVNSYQVWLARKQTLAAQRAADLAVTVAQSEGRNTVLYGDPKLLAWFLACRGFAGSSDEENRKRLFTSNKLLHDEAVHTMYRQGIIRQEVWEGWIGAIRADVVALNALSIWPAARYLYAADFADYIDGIIREIQDAGQKLNK